MYTVILWLKSHILVIPQSFELAYVLMMILNRKVLMRKLTPKRKKLVRFLVRNLPFFSFCVNLLAVALDFKMVLSYRGEVI